MFLRGRRTDLSLEGAMKDTMARTWKTALQDHWIAVSPTFLFRSATWLIVLSLLTGSLMLWHNIRERENNRAFDRETAWADAIHASVLEQIANLDGSLRWNERFLRNTGGVSQQMFAAINSNPALHSPAMAVLEWAPRIWRHERAAYESGKLWPGARPYAILLPDEDGAFHIAPESAYYFPITYAYARSGNQAALGMNIAYSDARRSLYERAARDGGIAESGIVPIYLSTYSQPVPGLVRSRPVYERDLPATPEERWRQLRGWLSTVIDIDTLFARAIDPYLTPDFDVWIYQNDASGSKLIAYRSKLGTSRSELPMTPFTSQRHDFVQSVMVGDQSWGLAIRPRSTWLAAQSHFESNLTLCAGLLISAFVWLTLERQRRYRNRMSLMHERLARAKKRTDAANVQLQNTVDELHRTRASLVQSEKLSSLGFLVAGVAHELNTPLGNALLAGTALSSRVRELHDRLVKGALTKSALQQFFDAAPPAADIVIRSVTSASDLVAKFKQLSLDQVSTQRRSFRAQSFIADCVRDATLRYTHLAIDFTVDVPTDIQLDSYPGTLEQVMSQLISNAVVHGLESRAGGAIHISAALDPDVPERMVLAVQDNGRGIAQAHLPHLFDPFFTTKMGRHSGLGLNLVYRFVTQVLGGELGVHSRNGVGTTFTLHLPLKAPSQVSVL